MLQTRLPLYQVPSRFPQGRLLWSRLVPLHRGEARKCQPPMAAFRSRFGLAPNPSPNLCFVISVVLAYVRSTGWTILLSNP